MVEPHFVDESATVLRHWLAETHTSVDAGQLEVPIGSLRFSTEVTYLSPTGAHGFGSIYVLGNDGAPVAEADARVLNAACAGAARERSGNDSVAAGVPASAAHEAWSIVAAEAPEDWITTAVDSVRDRVLAAGEEVGDLLASVVSQRILPVIGVLGRRGVVAEDDVLAVLVKSLSRLADTCPGGLVVRRWLASATLPAIAAFNLPGARYESPNPLRSQAISECGVAAAPVPEPAPEWSIRPIEIHDDDGGPDVRLVHRWMNLDHVASTWLQAWSLTRWRDELAHQLSGTHSLPCLVGYQGRQIGYLEIYRVVRDKLGECYPCHEHDLGVHIALGEPDAIGRGLGSSLLRSVAEGLLAADERCRRVVAEPDLHNGASIRAFTKAGFVRRADVGLPTKNAALMVFSR